MVPIGARLKKASEMIENGVPVADVGTDHAYLPAYLILNNRIPSAIASDIGVMPLKNAENTVKRYCLEDKIKLSVSDGLKALSFESEAEINITICGMGGTLISEILSDSAEKVKRDGVHLILQPMTHSEDVRLWLYRNGFKITNEDCVFDSGKTYCCMRADYFGQNEEKELGFYYFGTVSGATDEQRDDLTAQIKRIKKRLNALTQAGLSPDECKMLSDIYRYYEKRYGDEA